MIAYHGKEETKQFYLDRVKKHREMDEIIQGTGWDGKRGCAVGCTLENYAHAQYEKELGIPEWLAHLEDTIFEGLPKDKAMFWPERFLTSVKTGSDLEKVKTPFLIFILESCLESLDQTQFDEDKFPDVKKAVDGSRAAVKEVIRCHREGLDLSAARAAAWAARTAASAEAVAAAARTAAWAARAAAWAARTAAWAEAVAAYEKYADKLIELIEGCE